MLQHIQSPGPSQREQLEFALVSGAAAYLSAHTYEADRIAEGIQKVLDKLHPMPGPLKAVPVKLAVTEEMVGRFLSWALPEDFAPDCGITFTRSPHAGMNPTGTNLLHAGQARAMLEHCINGPFESPITLPVVDPGPDALERAMESKTYPDGTTASHELPKGSLVNIEVSR